ncbi:hypothetical protein SAMN02745166_02791 [Prosthecobacter debontii]|uniref:DUF2185 domain-containing protein n=1 Tax=Prosthecobacter debontii TaxID=48467 RepID=A0A1T4YA19_9BACT|nr:hypothetical protein SAMN02745166_02791 [Prosthecobacter debontii]
MKQPNSDWFSPLDPAVITTEAVAQRRQPVTRIVHEDGHGGWQFYDDIEPLRGPVVLPKPDMLALDPSLALVTDLPVGWEATRETVSDPWVRSELP